MLHGLNDIERVIGQTAAGIVEAEITRLAVQQDRYAEYVETVLKCSRATDTNKPEEPGPGPAGQTAKAGEGATGREAPTGAGGSSTEIGGSPALPDDGARSSPSSDDKRQLQWYTRRCLLAEHLLRDSKHTPAMTWARVKLKIAGRQHAGTMRVPVDAQGLPLTRPFLLEIRNLLNDDMGDHFIGALARSLEYTVSANTCGEYGGTITCKDQLVGSWSSDKPAGNARSTQERREP